MKISPKPKCCLAIQCGLALALAMAAPHICRAVPSVKIPPVTHAPKLEDFEDMAPDDPVAELLRVGDFIQRTPSDGQPATERTDAYFGYDQSNLYIIMVCWDSKHGVRADLTRREPSTPFDSDDYIEVTLDTFQDQRHAFVFDVNPRGVQADGLLTEGQQTDYSWDTLWYSRAKITKQGFVIWIAIPFHSLRFHPSGNDHWGVTLERYLARHDEYDFWPRVSSRIAGQLNQEATLTGFENVSPGRNMQFIPYVESRTFRTIDERDPTQPRYDSANFQGKAGLDSKFVFHDSLVLDTTIKP